MSIAAFLPIVGLVAYGVSFIYCISNYETDGTKYTHKDSHRNTYVRDTKLNRWLFNDVKWTFIDSMKNITKNNN